ncbi:ATP-binding cassette domain-containing protein [Pontibacillus yanchengensis]|uniref:ATP-binding cassette domain-containing protein n=1 Tax=Pontibacillus yanchengensis TaxID=462910 RepID=A0ACC7VM87_9BACI|nr:ATP-binding cassette domain-containing protein [Pontibacillus yanchengensis]
MVCTRTNLILHHGRIYPMLFAIPITMEDEIMTQSSFITLQHASKSFGDEVIFKHVQAQLSKGEILSIVGPSGSGKTTLLRCLAGLEPFSEGDFIIDNQNVTKLTANKRPVSLVFQQALLFPHMTILDNVAYGLTFQKIKKEERGKQAQEFIEKVGLKGYEKSFPHELSGGQQQRVSLARSLAISPDLILLDEPFSSLDPKLRHEMRDWVRKLLKSQQMTAIFVTHDREEAMQMGDRVGVFHDGVFQQIGTPQDVYRSPVNPFVATFFSDCLVLDGRKYVPVSHLYISKNTSSDAYLQLEAIVQNQVFIHGETFYQLWIESMGKRITLPSSLSLHEGGNVTIMANAEAVQLFPEVEIKE